jgi:putative aminopeptidase FrvX
MDLSLLKRLSETPGIPGWEDRVRALVEGELSGLVDDVRQDALGNLIAHRRGEGPRVMVAAHLDEIGFYVKYIDDHGFLRLQPVGGFDARNLFARRVVVHGSSGDLPGLLNPSGRPVHLSTPEERKKVPELREFFVDLGLSPEEVRSRVRVGDPVTLWQEASEVGELFSGKAMDDRASVFVLLETLRALRGAPLAFDLYAVFTTQEEVGLRGALTSAFGVEPEIGVALDVTLAVDIPGGAPDEAVSQLGKGVGIKILDNSMISHRGLVRTFVELAERHSLPYQLEVLPLGGTDGGAIQRSRLGVPTITLSVPTRYIHTVTETVHRKDLEAEITLLQAYLRG